MRITQVDPFLLSSPLPEPLRLTYHGGERVILKRDALLIRLRADNGLTGWAAGQASEAAAALVERVIGPFLTGHVLADPDALRVKFNAHFAGDPAAQRLYSAAEVALYDLLGQRDGVPVSELIGGRVRDSVRLYGSAGMYMDPEGYADEAAAVEALGLPAYKMRPGLGPELDIRAVERMRDSTGTGFSLMVDAHTWWRMGDRNYSPETVARLAAEMAEFDLTWLEEPLEPKEHARYAALRENCGTPLASGEHEPDEAGFLDLMDNACVDYVQQDLICQGGYPAGRRVLREVERRGLRFAFHCWGTDLELIIAGHLGVCWPDQVAEWLEYPIYRRQGVPVMYPFPLAHEVLDDPLPISSGHLMVPRAPGLGVRINEAVLERYPWIPGPWSTFTLISPPETWAVTGDHSVLWSGR
jgi:L-alanine-DL-glutamate epimerase-like enolase superfamily enzyme